MLEAATAIGRFGADAATGSQSAPLSGSAAPPGLLSGLSPAEQKLLLGAAQPRLTRRGAELRTADARPALLIIVQGSFRVELLAPSGQVVGMRTAGPGDWLGGYALVAGVPPYHVNIVAQQDGRILEIPEADVKRCMLTIPAFTQALLVGACESIVSFVDRIVELTTLSLHDRLLLELLRLTRGQNPPQCQVVLDPAPSQEALAGLLGVSREAVTRAFRRLSQARLLQTRRGRITVPDRRLLWDALTDPGALRLADHFAPLNPAGDASLANQEETA